MSLTSAVKQNCKDCTYDPSDKGTFLQQIEACAITVCALHEYRPLTRETREKLQQIKVNSMDVTQRMAYEAKVSKSRETMVKLRDAKRELQ